MRTAPSSPASVVSPTLAVSLALAVAFVPAGPVFAQAPPFDAPSALTEAFVRGQVRPASEALTGEAADNPLNPSRLPRAQRVTVEQQWRGGPDDPRALVAVEFADSSYTQDLYAFLTETPAGWRIEAFRSFDLPGVFFMQLNHYRGKGERALRADYERTFAESQRRGVTRAEHERAQGTADDLVFRVFNLRLTAGTDAELARHLEVLRDEFEALRRDIAATPPGAAPLDHTDAAFGERLSYLLLARAYHGADGPLRFELGGVEGDRVGYLYCTEPGCIPTPTPGGVIALVDLGEGWYLYRTT